MRPAPATAGTEQPGSAGTHGATAPAGGLLATCTPHLDWLSAALGDTPHALSLGDRSGGLLYRRQVGGMPADLETLCQAMEAGSAVVQLAAGDRSHAVAVVEKEVTDGWAGNHTDAQPPRLSSRPAAPAGRSDGWPEALPHEVPADERCTGLAVPVRDEAGALLGAICLALPAEVAAPVHLTQLAYAAYNAESEYARFAGRCLGPGDAIIAGEAALRAGLALEAARLQQDNAATGRRAERNAGFIRRLLGVTSRLATAITIDEVARIVTEDIVRACDASAGAFGIAEGGAIRVVRTGGYPVRLTERFTRIPIDSPLPLADCVRTGEPVFVGSPEEWGERYPHMMPENGGTGHRAFAAIPLRLDGTATGAIGLSYTAPRTFDPEEREFHLTVGRQCALALERVRLYDNLRLQLRERAREEKVLLAGKAELRVANEQLAFLSDTTARLLASDSPRELLSGLFQQLSALLDLEIYFNFLVAEQDGVRRLRLDSSAGVDEATAQSFEWLDFGVAVCGTAAAEERRIVVEDVGASEQDMTQLIRSLGVQAYACHPLIARGRLVGTLSFGTRHRGSFTAGQLALLQTVADHVAVAMDRAAAHAAECDARHAAEEASRAKSQFLAVMSHELRTPLTAIIGYADLLGTSAAGGMNETATSFIHRMRISSWHLRDVIDQILNLSRIEAGREEITAQPVAVSDLVSTSAALVQPQAQLRGLSLEVQVPAQRITIMTDPGKLRQILVNLLSNAVKFTESGGIQVLVEQEPSGSLMFEVTDTGVGIAVEDHERIWDPFTQVDQSNTRQAGGSGLGLSVSRRLSRLLGGELVLESAPGRGSTFTLRFPEPNYVADPGG